MKSLILLALCFAIPSFADIKHTMYELYQQGNYLQACNIGLKSFAQNQEDETYVSLYAFACLKADQIDRLAVPIMRLNQSEEARANAAYFSVIVMQKKLLMQALYDNKPINSLKFPTSGHLLSRVFDLYLKNPQSGQFVKEYQDPSDSRLRYKLYTVEHHGIKSISIDEYYDKILTVHHIY